MKSGWSGGQYSLLRIAYAPMLGVPMLAFGVAGLWHTLGTDHFAGLALPIGGCVLMFLASIALALGYRDRLAALIMLAVWCLVVRPRVPGWLDPLPVAEALLLFHLMTPRAPYLSWAARGRADPDGGWRLSGAHRWALRLLCAAGLATWLWIPDSGGPLPLLFFVPLVADPGWIAARGDGKERIFYDGTCGMCHRGIRFVMAEDRRCGMRFAPLGGATFEATIDEPTRGALPDSVVVVTSDGDVLTRSDAVLHVNAALGGYWRVAAGLERLIPRGIRNWQYDTVAARRQRWFGSTTAACPVVSEDLRVRFDP